MPEAQPAYTVAVVVFNSRAWLLRCMAFYQQCEALVFVDNASEDDSCAVIQSHFPNATLIRNRVNLGFGAACNQAIAAAQTDRVLLLNPDCLCTHEAIAQLHSTLVQDASIAIVAPQIMTKHAQPEVSYRMGQFNWTPKLNAAAQGLLCVAFVSGACMLLRMSAVNTVRGFDERYFMYYEDEDLCLRLRQQHWSIVLDPRAVVQHFARTGSQQTGWAQWRSEFKRGRAHLSSKLLFYRSYKPNMQRVGRYQLTLAKLLFLTVISIPFVAVLALLKPKYLARLLGRLRAIVESF